MSEIKDLIGIYPLNMDCIKENKIYQERTLKELEKLKNSWEPINEAAKIVSRKIDEYRKERLIDDLIDRFEKELSNASDKIASDLIIPTNKDQLTEIIEKTQSSKAEHILITRKIRYGWREDYIDSDYGWQNNQYCDFTQGLDFILNNSNFRLEIGGDIQPLRKKPKLRINYVNLCELEKQRGKEDLIEYLKNYGRTKTFENGFQRIALQTITNAGDFFKGNQINLKDSTLSDLSSEPFERKPSANLKLIPILPEISEITRIINSQIGKVPYYNNEDSFLSYDSRGNQSQQKKGGIK